MFGGGGEKGFVPSDHRRLNFVPEVLPSSLSWQKGDLDIRRPGNGWAPGNLFKRSGSVGCEVHMTIEVKQRFSVHAEPATAIRNIHEI